MTAITIQFKGICCHIDPPSGSPKRRSVLPNVPQHIPYIEVYSNDIADADNPDFTISTPYTRYNSSYRRVEVIDVKIELLNITSSSFTVMPSYDQRIPKLRSVEPRFTAVKPTLLAPVIGPNEVAAFFDMTVGVLSSGPSEHFRTVFDPPHDWPVRHLGQWVQLDVEMSGNAPMLLVTGLGGGSRTLVLKEGADLVTIGNQTLLDILGTPNVTGHFAHFYELSDTPLSNPDPPTPKEGQGLGIGCSDTNWP
jgi:hypothetical protein